MGEMITFQSNKSIDHSIKVIMEDMRKMVLGMPVSRSNAIRYAIDRMAVWIMQDRQLHEAFNKKD